MTGPAFVVTVCALALLPAASCAQERLRQATIVVGSPAGGATDKLARLYAEGLRQTFANTVVVENRPGATGIIAYEYVKNSGQKDGSLTFLSPTYPMAISPHVTKLPYDTLRDFTPVAIGARSAMTYAVGPAVPAAVTTMAEYLQWCRDNPKLALYAAQTGSSQHLLGAILALSSKVPLANVSYKGDAPAVQDMLGGHVPAVVLPIASALQLYRAGRIRVLAIGTRATSRYLPEVPTFQELGFKDIVFQDWRGFFAPAGADAAAVRAMNDAIAEVARSEQGQKTLAGLGLTPEIVSPEVFAETLKADYQRYGGLIERTRFKEAFDRARGG
ncbi:MAG: twin-arginine translocation pathway signal protein [Burkholderiales bacterium]|nr:twin-arginine translocation pathway signal protein [Burkholderiales bacterium]